MGGGAQAVALADQLMRPIPIASSFGFGFGACCSGEKPQKDVCGGLLGMLCCG